MAWFLDGIKIKTNYNVVGKFKTTLKVENMTGRKLFCILMGDGGNGDKCHNCGWVNSKLHEEFPDRVICPNLISLNKARKLYKESKPFVPDFNDFIDGYNFYGEMEFTYNGVTYGLMGIENKGVEFWGINTDIYEMFNSIDEFVEKAKIDGKPVKEIWNEVENANWLQ